MSTTDAYTHNVMYIQYMYAHVRTLYVRIRKDLSKIHELKTDVLYTYIAERAVYYDDSQHREQ